MSDLSRRQEGPGLLRFARGDAWVYDLRLDRHMSIRSLSMLSRTLLPPLALALCIGCRTNGPVMGQTAGISTEVTLEVVSKRSPDALVARDGSTCRVAPDVYARTIVGSMFRCRWSRS